MGGPPQHSTWDPKPDAPAEVRGEFRPIATTVPGPLALASCCRAPRASPTSSASSASVSTGDNAHSSSGYYMLTGRPHAPMNFENANPGAPNDAPSLGALLGKVGGARGGLPPTITLPHRIFNTDGSVWPGQDAGLLGRSADPWLLNARLTPEGYRIQEIDLPADIDPGRLGRRKGLLDRLGRGLDDLGRDAAAELLDGHTRRAFDLLRLERGPQGVPARRGARGEPPSATARLRSARGSCWPAGWSRRASGWCRSTGTGAPTSRRPTPAGTATPVSRPGSRTSWCRRPTGPTRPCWTTCTSAGCSTRPWSSAWPSSAARRDSTPTAVADHWGSVFSVAMAGGGVRGGQVYGASDRIGAYPREGRVRPEDLSATIFHCLGYRPADRVHRPPRPAPPDQPGRGDPRDPLGLRTIAAARSRIAEPPTIAVNGSGTALIEISSR